MRRLPVSPVVSYQMDLTTDCPTIRVDPFHLEQVMYNLLLNAFHAITQEDSGLARKDKSPGLVTIKTRKVKKLLEISVADNGIGIPSENIQKIFEPLFTTKIKGMGLGLAISKKLIEANGGTIEVISTIGKGSTFTVHLPTNS
jgi:signal transduction histidine kinase